MSVTSQLAARERIAVRLQQARGAMRAPASSQPGSGRVAAAAAVPGGWFGGWLGVSPYWLNAGSGGGGRGTIGVTDGSAAGPGEIGEVLTLMTDLVAFDAAAGAAGAVNVTTLVLTPGDWNVWGTMWVNEIPTEGYFFNVECQITTESASTAPVEGLSSLALSWDTGNIGFQMITVHTGQKVMNVSVATPIYLVGWGQGFPGVADAPFPISFGGRITARRMR